MSAARVATSRRHRRVGGHRAEQLGLGPDHGDIGQTITAERDRGRDIEQHLARVVRRTAPARHGASAADSARCQPATLRQSAAAAPTRRRDQRLADRIQHQIPTTRLRFTYGVPFRFGILTFDKPRIPSRTGTSVRYSAVVTQSHERSRLAVASATPTHPGRTGTRRHRRPPVVGRGIPRQATSSILRRSVASRKAESDAAMASKKSTSTPSCRSSRSAMT